MNGKKANSLVGGSNTVTLAAAPTLLLLLPPVDALVTGFTPLLLVPLVLAGGLDAAADVEAEDELEAAAKAAK